MVKKIAVGFAAVVVLLVAVIASRPGEFLYERSIDTSAPPAAVYALIADFHGWSRWSPWDALDPSQKKTYSGAAAGVGALTEWKGNEDVGEGRMTITEAKAPEFVVIKLEFLKPFQVTSTTTFRLAPKGTGTSVRWSMAGTNNFAAKAAGLVMDMKKGIEADFDRGLAAMQRAAEEDAKAAATAAEAEAAAAAKAAAEAAAAAAEAAAAALDGGVVADPPPNSAQP